MSVSLVVIGGTGRLGRAVLDLAGKEPGFSVGAIVARRPPASGEGGGPPCFPELERALAAVPDAVVIDAAPAEGAALRVEAVRTAQRPLVMAGTNLDAATGDALRDAAGEIPVVVAPNLSPGIALLGRALRTVLASPTPAWDVTVLERHHRRKLDAPSGTAKLLAEIITASRGAGEPPGMASFRQGEVVGEHSIYLSGTDEELVFLHRAQNRLAFARGALLAGAFVASSSPGHFTMDNVLGLG